MERMGTRLVSQVSHLVCSSRFEPLGVVEPVESECSRDSEHVDLIIE